MPSVESSDWPVSDVKGVDLALFFRGTARWLETDQALLRRVGRSS